LVTEQVLLEELRQEFPQEMALLQRLKNDVSGYPKEYHNPYSIIILKEFSS
jgi:hypothetical protein